MSAPPERRDEVTRDVYNRLFEAVPWHHANVRDPAAEDAYEDFWFRLYGPLTRPSDTLVDLGCGRGGLVRRFARGVREAVGIEASDAMVALCERERPPNVRFLRGSVVEPPLPPGSADMVVSRQVMEHLHPEDVPRHLAAVHRILRPGGRYLVETPSRLTGPWDVSRGFTPEASGFHLREYTNAELGEMMRRAGFRRVRGPALPTRLMARLGPARRRAWVPLPAKAAIERALEGLPAERRTPLCRALAVREVALVGERDTA
jgi:SAM-dependent methyltransferase